MSEKITMLMMSHFEMLKLVSLLMIKLMIISQCKEYVSMGGGDCAFGIQYNDDDSEGVYYCELLKIIQLSSTHS